MKLKAHLLSSSSSLVRRRGTIIVKKCRCPWTGSGCLLGKMPQVEKIEGETVICGWKDAQSCCIGQVEEGKEQSDLFTHVQPLVITRGVVLYKKETPSSFLLSSVSLPLLHKDIFSSPQTKVRSHLTRTASILEYHPILPFDYRGKGSYELRIDR